MIVVTGGVPGFRSYDNFVTKVTEIRNHPESLEYIGSLYPKHNESDYYSQGNPPFIYQEDSSFLKSSITSIFASFWYEATVALGLAACAAHEKNPWFTGVEHFEQLKQTRFGGVTGFLTFDPETGSRDPNSALYTVTNFVEQDLGDGTVRFQRVITDMFQNSKWNQVEQYIFNDGTTRLPPDLPPPPPPAEIVVTNDVIGPLEIGVMVGGVVLVLSVLIFLFYEKRRRDSDSVWKVKKEELTFDYPPIVIGSGSFGRVLLAEYRGTQVAVKKVLPPRKQNKSVAANGKSNSPISIFDSSFDDNTEHEKVLTGRGSMVSTDDSYDSFCRSRDAHKSGVLSSWGGMNSADYHNQTKRDFSKGPSSGASNWKRLKKDFMDEMGYLSKLRHPCVVTIMVRNAA